MVAINNSDNNQVGASNSGVTNTFTVTNPSNTASSQAQVNVTVGGGTAGDAYTTYTVSGVTNWSEGVDNSASDAFVISASTALGTTNVVSMVTGGNVSFVLGDLDVTRSSSGSTVTDTISNTSNTASSNALQQVTVAGTSAGDSFTTYTVSGTTNWSVGTDNSVSNDPFVVSASTALGTTNVLSMTTAGAASFVLGNLDVTKSASGADVSVTASNTSNTASSTATHYATVAGTSAGDAQIQYAVSGTTTWTHGIDNSASDAFVLSASTALGTTDVMSVATTGEINYPLQSAFLANNSVTDTNVTGDGTGYTIVCDTEIYDQNSDYNNSTGTFTAPVTGRYMISSIIWISNIASALFTTGFFSFTTSNRTYYWGLCNPSTVRRITDNDMTQACSTYADFDSGDTMTIGVSIGGSTKTLSVASSTYLSANLIC